MLVLIFAIFVALVLFALVRSIIAPIMVIVAVAVGWHWLTGPSMDAKATSNTATAAPSISLPSKQAQFCAIIEKADIAYEPERSAWYSESNSIKQDRIGRRLEVMRDERDQAIYDLLSHDRLTVQGWVIRLTEMLTSEEAEAQGRVRYVSLTGTAHCQREVTFHAKLPLTPELEVLLGDTKLGSEIQLDGQFLSHDADSNPPPRALDWDGFQSTAMQSPSYYLKVASLARFTQ